jgi:hypothetical protein
MVFSGQSVMKYCKQSQLAVAVIELEKCCGAVVVRCYREKLVAEDGDSLGTQRKRNICH